MVIAMWQLEGGMHSDVTGIFKVAEAVTDESGQYRIPAWGPLARPARGILDSYDPLIYVFKSGYSIHSLHHPLGAPKARSNLEKHDSIFNGRPILLHKFAKAPKAYSMQVASFVGANLDEVFSKGCQWRYTEAYKSWPQTPNGDPRIAERHQRKPVAKSRRG